MPDGSPAVRSRFRLAIVYVVVAPLVFVLWVIHNTDWICSGGGIAGLTLAVALGRYEQSTSPIQIDLYESGPEITTVGAGISVWPRTWAVMRALGLYDELANEAVKEAGGEDGDLRAYRPQVLTPFIYPFTS